MTGYLQDQLGFKLSPPCFEPTTKEACKISNNHYE